MKINRKTQKILAWSFFLIYAVIIYKFDLETRLSQFVAFVMLGILAGLEVLVFNKEKYIKDNKR